ncbi:hypothetical protein LTR62_002354 [Meristemomyces frigidus]|uniref:DNA/RNA-binding protein Kin17 WH-like domain-containing protein n=1 Tax=Meristemomyces frigidus TaxID=1508187 RepID=A0AAN7YKP8_9PEZI|nr:hypothetical protein LTR62_002354 [Meristemomyces frigidus]
MPKAEVGSIKHLGNKMKAKGLQRLRWWCQICQKQCRDENGFKQHTMSEGHVRSMLLVGEDPKKFINDYSNQFQRDFLRLLKTSHGEKSVSLNGFYQEYIRDKEHVHMNSTKWPSLTEFAKFLGTEGICRVVEGERGLEVQWVDDSAQAIERREDAKRKERLVKGDEGLESRLLEQQIRRAREAAERTGRGEEEKGLLVAAETGAEPARVSLKLGGKAVPKQESAPAHDAPVAIETFSTADPQLTPPLAAGEVSAPNNDNNDDNDNGEEEPTTAQSPRITAPPQPKMSLSLSSTRTKPSNPLMKKNPLSKSKPAVVAAPEKRMSNAERIMKEELERKRVGEQRGIGGGGKRQRLA